MNSSCFQLILICGMGGILNLFSNINSLLFYWRLQMGVCVLVIRHIITQKLRMRTSKTDCLGSNPKSTTHQQVAYNKFLNSVHLSFNYESNNTS